MIFVQLLVFPSSIPSEPSSFTRAVLGIRGAARSDVRVRLVTSSTFGLQLLPPTLSPSLCQVPPAMKPSSFYWSQYLLATALALLVEFLSPTATQRDVFVVFTSAAIYFHSLEAALRGRRTLWWRFLTANGLVFGFGMSVLAWRAVSRMSTSSMFGT